MHVGHELERARAGEVREQHEWFEERIRGVVVAGPVRAVGDVRAEHVVVHEQVVVPRVFEPLDQPNDRVGIDGPELPLREDRSEPHRRTLRW